MTECQSCAIHRRSGGCIPPFPRSVTWLPLCKLVSILFCTDSGELLRICTPDEKVPVKNRLRQKGGFFRVCGAPLLLRWEQSLTSKWDRGDWLSELSISPETQIQFLSSQRLCRICLTLLEEIQHLWSLPPLFIYAPSKETYLGLGLLFNAVLIAFFLTTKALVGQLWLISNIISFAMTCINFLLLLNFYYSTFCPLKLSQHQLASRKQKFL